MSDIKIQAIMRLHLDGTEHELTAEDARKLRDELNKFLGDNEKHAIPWDAPITMPSVPLWERPWTSDKITPKYPWGDIAYLTNGAVGKQ